MPTPIESAKNITNVHELPFNQLSVEFQQKLLELRTLLFGNPRVKCLNNVEVNGAELVEFAEKVLSKKIPHIKCVWDEIVAARCKDARKRVLAYFKQ